MRTCSRIITLFAVSSVLAISISAPAPSDARAVSYNRLLIPDSSFANSGTATTNFGQLQTIAMATDLVVQPDGKVLSAGRSCQVNNEYLYWLPGCGEIVLMRHLKDGSPDPSFGVNGLVMTSIAFYLPYSYFDGIGRHMLLQPDGKIIVGGSRGGKAVLARYASDGSLDTTFGNGVVTLSANFLIGVTALALQADGKILVASASSLSQRPCSGALRVTRHTADGLLDSTFGENGVFIACGGAFPESLSSSAAHALEIQNTGKILVFVDRARLFRILPTGQFDASFEAADTFPFLDGSAVMTLLPDDKILFGVRNLQRLMPDGQPDPGFGTNGIVTLTLTNTIAADVAAQPDGKIIRVGFIYYPSPICCVADQQAFMISRHTADGNLDATFGAGGVVTSTFSAALTPQAMHLQSDGKIVVGGWAQDVFRSNYIVARFRTDGLPDSSFGASGRASVSLYSDSHDAMSMIRIQSDGKVIGIGGSLVGKGERLASVARYLSNGALDPEYGDGGRAMIRPDPFVIAHDYIKDTALQPDDKLVLAFNLLSRACTPPDYACIKDGFALARLSSDGKLDASFGAQGIQTTQIPATAVSIGSVISQSDQKIIALGTSCQPLVQTGSCNSSIDESYRLLFARYWPNGQPDDTFGVSGIVTQPYQSLSGPSNFALSQAEELLVAGRAQGLTGPDYSAAVAVQRYTADGRLDTTFGINGVAKVNVYERPGGGLSYYTSHVTPPLMQVAPDGKITLISAGTYNDRGYITDLGFVIVRFTADGLLDATFGSQGVMYVNEPRLYPSAFILQKDGRMVLTSSRSIEPPLGEPSSRRTITYVVRLNAHGGLDTSFGLGGIYTLLDAPGTTLAIDDAGNTLLAGMTQSGSPADFALTRYRDFTPVQSLALPFVTRDTFTPLIYP
jgi:uncharacterized delta-60 repeat protein